MLLMLLIGWIVVLPALVVAGLYVASALLGRRHAALRAYEDLLSEEPDPSTPLEPEVVTITPSMITGQDESRPATQPRLAAADAARRLHATAGRAGH